MSSNEPASSRGNGVGLGSLAPEDRFGYGFGGLYGGTSTDPRLANLEAFFFLNLKSA